MKFHWPMQTKTTPQNFRGLVWLYFCPSVYIQIQIWTGQIGYFFFDRKMQLVANLAGPSNGYIPVPHHHRHLSISFI